MPARVARAIRQRERRWKLRPVQSLTPAGALDREKMPGCVAEMTDIVAETGTDPTLGDRTWVLITESPDGGWVIGGHAYTRAEIADAARKARRKT